MAMLGEDGRGYELARKLDTCGVWRTWLGDATYANFAPFLSSPSAWDSFITSTTHIPLQLRVRALLFDKATASLSPNPNPSLSIQRLNPSYLQLHADDIYFTLDADSKNQSKPSSSTGSSNFTPLVDVVKDGSKNNVQQSQQQIHGMQPQLQQQQQSSLRLPQQLQMQRQMHPQMQQMIHSQNMAFHQQQHQQQQQQQQFERLRRRAAAATPRPAMDIDKERPLVQVKIENQDLPLDGNNAFTSRHPQIQQFRQQQQQQQIAAMSNFHPQSGTQFRHMGSLQIPSIQSPNTSMVRAPPVKVEGFSELMGGDSTSKHDLEENRLTSPNVLAP